MSTTGTLADPGRRALLTGAPEAGSPAATAWKPARARDGSGFDPVAAERASRLGLLQRLAPNVEVVDQNGRRLRFFNDVLQGRQVVLSAMYSACEQFCPPTMRNLMEARQQLGPVARRLRFVTMTLTPVSDDPQELRRYKHRFGIDPDWLFLTGRPEELERLQAALGYAPRRISDNALTHASMVRVIDERLMRIGHVNGLTSARNISRMIRFELA